MFTLDNIIKFVLIILALIINIGLVLYVRIFKNRLIIYINYPYSDMFIYINICVIIICLLILSYLIYKMYVIKLNDTKNKWQKKIISFLQWFQLPLMVLKDYLEKNISFYKNIAGFLTPYYFNYDQYYKILIIILIYGVKILILLIFIYDIIYNKRIYWIYYFLPLLLIYPIIKIILSMMLFYVSDFYGQLREIMYETEPELVRENFMKTDDGAQLSMYIVTMRLKSEYGGDDDYLSSLYNKLLIQQEVRYNQIRLFQISLEKHNKYLIIILLIILLLFCIFNLYMYFFLII